MSNKQKIWIFFVLVLICRITCGVLGKFADLKEKKYQFAGVLQKVYFGEKGIPEVIVDGKRYWGLSTDDEFNKKMAVGDSLIKKKNEMTYKLIKRKTREVVLSK